MVVYRGSITTTGSSESIRLDKPFFMNNKAFKQKNKVVAYPISPGSVLISVVDSCREERDWEEDPFLRPFLSFIEQDLIKNPENLSFVTQEERGRIVAITDGIKVSDCDIIPEDITL